jgi:hypothetical protein
LFTRRLLSAISVKKVIVERHFLVIEMVLRGAADDGPIASGRVAP